MFVYIYVNGCRLDRERHIFPLGICAMPYLLTPSLLLVVVCHFALGFAVIAVFVVDLSG